MAPENRLKKLVAAYNGLQQARRNAVGVVVSEGTVETKTGIAEFEQGYSELALDTRIGMSRLRDVYTRVFRRNFRTGTRWFLEIIQQVRLEYGSYTQRRSRYGLLAPVACCKEDDLARCLGGEEAKCNLGMTWNVVFKQLNALSTDTGFLDVFGINHSDFMIWWTGSESLQGQKETRVWIDVKTLAAKLVDFLDRLLGEERKELSLVRLNDKDSQHVINEVIPALIQLSQNVIRLLYIRQENIRDVLTVFETLVPVVHAFDMVLSYPDDKWVVAGYSSLNFLSEYVKTLCLHRNSLIEQLDAVEEMRVYSIVDSKIAFIMSRSSSEGIEIFTDARCERNSKFNQEAIDGLKRLRLEEKNVVINYQKSLGDGSFANVFKCNAVNDNRELAVKFLKPGKPNDPPRMKNRLLREAAFWSKLNHENINALLGFCVHPDHELPGLISQSCDFSLDQFLATDEGRTADQHDRLCYMYDIASGLDYMHKMKVIHGDLRPPNVLLIRHILGSGYTAVLGDFGISYPDEESCEFDHTSMQRTNAPYIAPELLAKQAKKGEIMLSRPGDIYAFGCVFLEVMCGITPYEGIPKGQVEKCKKSGMLPAQKERVDVRYRDFLQRTWRASPDNRPKTNDLLIDIHSLKVSTQ